MEDLMKQIKDLEQENKSLRGSLRAMGMHNSYLISARKKANEKAERILKANQILQVENKKLSDKLGYAKAKLQTLAEVEA